MDYRQEYQRWLARVTDAELLEELRGMDEAAIEDAFYRDLAFGTGGLRGVIGAGSNRMNVYTVARASQGLADYLNRRFSAPSAVIGYDSRIKSDAFARVTAGVLAANGVQVHFWPQLTPVPTVSFATRCLGASAGVMITASHNPAQYNGYKVYGADGCQVTVEAASEILSEIEKLDLFDGVKRADFDACLREGRIQPVPDAVLTAFLEAVKAQSVLFGEEARKDIAIVYSPLNGTGYVPVTRALKELGYTHLTLVEEQRLPDGHFPTCPYPNPEIFEALRLGLELAEKTDADLMLATDPDADRVGIAIRCPDGSYELVSGNEVGVLLLDYICQGRIEKGTMPKRPVAVKSLVSTPLADIVAADYGVEMRNVLTGFKWIGDQIAKLEAAGEVDRFILGFEESYGYLAGPYVRDKDAIIGSMLICEMAAYYRSIGSSIKARLEAIYAKYGRYLNKVNSFEFPGLSGMDKMAGIMASLREKPPVEIGGYKVTKITDYQNTAQTGLPAANVLVYNLEGGATVIVRPSGTEPKIKTYFTTLGKDLAEAETQEKVLADALKPILA